MRWTVEVQPGNGSGHRRLDLYELTKRSTRIPGTDRLDPPTASAESPGR
ncbi:hypothetical protein [Deinococcus sp. Arct2-2]|nr:hypothetical protein [Deinococcus sp. Arct2-2]